MYDQADSQNEDSVSKLTSLLTVEEKLTVRRYLRPSEFETEKRPEVCQGTLQVNVTKVTHCETLGYVSVVLILCSTLCCCCDPFKNS